MVLISQGGCIAPPPSELETSYIFYFASINVLENIFSYHMGSSHLHPTVAVYNRSSSLYGGVAQCVPPGAMRPPSDSQKIPAPVGISVTRSY